MTDDLVIDLDRKRRAIRSGDRWAVQELQPEGHWDMIASWDGNRRSLYQWLERNHIAPTREAEARLALLPEAAGFRDRM